MKSSVLKCIGLGLGLQELLWGDFCGICGLEHKPELCPMGTLEFRLNEFEVDDWDSDAEEEFVVQQETRARLLRDKRNQHHCKTLKYELHKTNGVVDPLKADKIYRALLEKCDNLLSEVKTLCDLVQVLDMGQTCKVCKAAQEEQRRREEEAKKPKGFTGQQLVNYVVKHSTPNKRMLANQMVRFKRIQPGATYLNLSQLDLFFS